MAAAALTLARPLAIAAAKALGVGALSGSAGFGISKLLKKITVSQPALSGRPGRPPSDGGARLRDDVHGKGLSGCRQPADSNAGMAFLPMMAAGLGISALAKPIIKLLVST